MRQQPRNPWRDEGGAVAATYAIALLGMIVVAGVGYDYTRMTTIDSELQNAADQAALAAATQLDGLAETSTGAGNGACNRARTAALSLLRNITLLANDGSGNAVTFTATETGCTSGPGVRFWQDKAKSTLATNDSNARFVEVYVNPRQALYALTPVMATIRGSGPLNAGAFAGVGTAICRVPPIMICSPDPSQPFNANGRIGQGIIATGHQPNNSGNQGGNAGNDTTSANWSSGNFGFLQIPAADNGARNARLLQALAFNNPPIDCVAVDGNKVSPGNPQGLYDAINTRFGIYDFPSNGGATLAPCQGGACSPAPNVRMDHVSPGGNGNNACKMGNNGYEMPSGGSEFNPLVTTPENNNTRYDTTISRMGLPRDLCHYDTYSTDAMCDNDANPATAPVAGGRFGDGKWARNDYWSTSHPGVSRPTGWDTMTRYQTYLWEIANSRAVAPATCAPPAGDAGRRVLTLAVVSNCAALNGGAVDVVIDEWIDAFLVEPATDNSNRHMGNFRDAVYFEVIGKSKLAGAGSYASQQVRRDVPYLIE